MRTLYQFLIPILSLAFISSTYATPLVNQLKNHPSPYLALHADDPVHWQDWNKDVVVRAKKENKLIFISSGYFSCHWCHVMQRESFSDKSVAELLNQLAIPVKIDRELQPALDAWLIEFSKNSTGRAGWPLNVFLTPEGYPLVGFTYQPKEDFIGLVNNIQQRWNKDETYLKDLAKNSFELKPATKTHSGYDGNDKTSERLTQLLISHALHLGDDFAGGFGEQRKFPMSPQLIALLDTQQQQPNEELSGFLSLTLDNMANLGLRDHIAGGFFRYTIDRSWNTPHFEKMLYDNAQLALVYLRAARILNKPEYLDITKSTLDFVMTHMKHTNNGYIASLSAVDDKDIEGGFYLWSDEELSTLLNKKELSVAKLVWGIKDVPLSDAGHHLKNTIPVTIASKSLSLAESDIKQILLSAKNKLKQARNKRHLPVDDKVLAGWNGLMLTSLSEAAGKTNSKHYYEAAKNLYHYLSTQMWDGKQLYRFIHNGNYGGQVSLEDYAYVAQGILAWAKLRDDKKAWSTSLKIALAGLNLFHNKNGWKISENLLIPYDSRELALNDNTMPSPSASLLKTLLTITHHNQDIQLRKNIFKLMDSDLEEINNSPLWYASHISLIANIVNEPR